MHLGPLGSRPTEIRPPGIKILLPLAEPLLRSASWRESGGRDMRGMNDPDEVLRHRRRAQLCIEISAKMGDPGHRLALLEMAKAWLTLAETVENRTKGGG